MLKCKKNRKFPAILLQYFVIPDKKRCSRVAVLHFRKILSLLVRHRTVFQSKSSYGLRKLCGHHLENNKSRQRQYEQKKITLRIKAYIKFKFTLLQIHLASKFTLLQFHLASNSTCYNFTLLQFHLTSSVFSNLNFTRSLITHIKGKSMAFGKCLCSVDFGCLWLLLDRPHARRQANEDKFHFLLIDLSITMLVDFSGAIY